MIKKFKALIEKVIPKPIKEEKIECAIDEEVVGCESEAFKQDAINYFTGCLLYTSPSPRDATLSRMPSSA